jgi:hypothetical protein
LRLPFPGLLEYPGPLSIYLNLLILNQNPEYIFPTQVTKVDIKKTLSVKKTLISDKSSNKDTTRAKSERKDTRKRAIQIHTV